MFTVEIFQYVHWHKLQNDFNLSIKKAVQKIGVPAGKPFWVRTGVFADHAIKRLEAPGREINSAGMLDWLRFRTRAGKYRNKIDPLDLGFLTDVLKKGQCALDIGAHKGGYLYWMQRSVGRNGRVFAFEPQRELYEYLTHLIRKYGYRQTTVIHAAVSNKAGKAMLHAPGHRTTTGATLEENVFPENDSSFEVETLTIDGFLSDPSRAGVAVNLMKIDVETHELAVLQGAKKTLTTHRPVVMFECEQRVYKDKSIFDVFKFLSDLKFKGFFFFKGKLMSLQDFRLEVHQNPEVPGMPLAPDYANNFIFIPEEKVGREINLEKYM